MSRDGVWSFHYYYYGVLNKKTVLSFILYLIVVGLSGRQIIGLLEWGLSHFVTRMILLGL